MIVFKIKVFLVTIELTYLIPDKNVQGNKYSNKYHR